jgi:hypothetical protein
MLVYPKVAGNRKQKRILAIEIWQAKRSRHGEEQQVPPLGLKFSVGMTNYCEAERTNLTQQRPADN